MLHVFAMATHALSSFSGVLKMFQHVCSKYFSCFEHMLQVFHLNVAKVDMVLHMLQWDSPVVAVCLNYWGAIVGHRASA
jgi:hypothetical protein